MGSQFSARRAGRLHLEWPRGAKLRQLKSTISGRPCLRVAAVKKPCTWLARGQTRPLRLKVEKNTFRDEIEDLPPLQDGWSRYRPGFHNLLCSRDDESADSPQTLVRAPGCWVVGCPDDKPGSFEVRLRVYTYLWPYITLCCLFGDSVLYGVGIGTLLVICVQGFRHQGLE